MNEKKQSGYPQEDPRAELERLMQDKPLKRPGGKDRKEPAQSWRCMPRR